jgi:hypothetical protein
MKCDPTDLIGQTIGRLTVETLGRKVGGIWHYTCRCTCGNLITVKRKSLLGPKPPVQSCGCLKVDMRNAHEARERAVAKATLDFYVHRGTWAQRRAKSAQEKG